MQQAKVRGKGKAKKIAGAAAVLMAGAGKSSIASCTGSATNRSGAVKQRKEMPRYRTGFFRPRSILSPISGVPTPETAPSPHDFRKIVHTNNSGKSAPINIEVCPTVETGRGTPSRRRKRATGANKTASSRQRSRGEKATRARRQGPRVDILNSAWKLGGRADYRASTASIASKVLGRPVFADLAFAFSHYSAVGPGSEAKLSRIQSKVQAISEDFRGKGAHLYMPVVRTLGWVLGHVWRRLFSRVDVDEDNVRMAKSYIEKFPTVLLPSHKSHVDYLMMSYLTFAYGIPMPVICAGDNLNISLVGPLLRRAGCFFMKRSFSAPGEARYRTACGEYVKGLLVDADGEGRRLPLEFFMEGGRSRHGKLIRAKLGMLQMVVDGMAAHPNQDCMFVPVALTYDLVPEGEDYAQQLLGKPKKPESIAGVVSLAAQMLLSSKKKGGYDCGRAYIRFAKPMSMRTLLKEHGSDLAEVSNAVQRATAIAGVVPATALVATVLLAFRPEGNRFSVAKVKEGTQKLETCLKVAGAQVPECEWDMEEVLQQLGCEVVHPGKGAVYTVFPNTATVCLQLSFLRNQLVHFFVGTYSGLERDIMRNEYRYGLESFPTEKIPAGDRAFFQLLLGSFSLPYLEGYWASALTLAGKMEACVVEPGADPRSPRTLKHLDFSRTVVFMRNEMSFRFMSGQLNCLEALSKDTLANGLLWCSRHSQRTGTQLSTLSRQLLAIFNHGGRSGIVLRSWFVGQTENASFLPIGCSQRYESLL